MDRGINRVPDIFDPEAVEEAEQGLLFLFLNNAKRLATESGKNGIWSGAYAGPTGGKELVVTFLETGAPAEDGRKIRALVRIFSPALQGPEDPAEHGDEWFGEEYRLYQKEREGDVDEFSIDKKHIVFSRQGMAEFYLKLAELQAYAPEEARAMIESHERDVRARQEADKQAKAKGANIGIKKEIEGLNVYLQHFIDQLEAKEKNE